MHFFGIVCYEIFNWLGVVFTLRICLCYFKVLLASEIQERWKRVVACVPLNFNLWVLWMTRNDAIFAYKQASILKVVNYIKRLSWQWLLAKKVGAPLMVYE
jgi:hypothetical protein